MHKPYHKAYLYAFKAANSISRVIKVWCIFFRPDSVHESEDVGERYDEDVVSDQIDEHGILLAIDCLDWTEQHSLHAVEEHDCDDEFEHLVGQILQSL